MRLARHVCRSCMRSAHARPPVRADFPALSETRQASRSGPGEQRARAVVPERDVRRRAGSANAAATRTGTSARPIARHCPMAHPVPAYSASAHTRETPYRRRCPARCDPESRRDTRGHGYGEEDPAAMAGCMPTLAPTGRRLPPCGPRSVRHLAVVGETRLPRRLNDRGDRWVAAGGHQKQRTGGRVSDRT